MATALEDILQRLQGLRMAAKFIVQDFHRDIGISILRFFSAQILGFENDTHTAAANYDLEDVAVFDC